MAAMRSRTATDRELVVGSWPGEEFRDNPYIGRFCESLRLAGMKVRSVVEPWRALNRGLDVLHIHWPEQVLWGHRRAATAARAAAVIAALTALRAQGVRLVWCVHNLEPHDAGRMLKLAWPQYAGLVARLVHGFVTLSPSTVALARARFAGFADKPSTFIWHAPYRMIDNAHHGARWREQHGIPEDATLISFVGAIRPYKGVLELARCFTEIRDPRLRLMVAGEVTDAALRDSLEELARREPRMRLLPARLTEQELQEAVLAANAIVLPFERNLHSGSMIYALSCGKPVITPRSPYSGDLSALIGSDWVRTYEPPLTPTTLAHLCGSGVGVPDLEPLSLQASGLKLRDFYRSLGALPRR